MKVSGSTILIITHRTPILALADKLLVLKNGSVAAFGGRDEVLKSINTAKTKITKLPQTAAPRPPILVENFEGCNTMTSSSTRGLTNPEI